MRRLLSSLLNRLLLPRLRAAASEALDRSAQDLRRSLQLEARDLSARLVRKHMGGARALEGSESVMEYACGLIQPEAEGLIVEFGVWRGATLNRLARVFPKRIVYGFDSFTGLPEDWRDGFPKGHFRMVDEPKVEPNVRLVKGLFSRSLPGFLVETSGKVLLAHVDCDLYSSAKTVLTELRSRLVAGTVIVFDEYFNYSGWEEGEHRALVEFAAETTMPFEYVAYNRTGEQVAVRLGSPSK